MTTVVVVIAIVAVGAFIAALIAAGMAIRHQQWKDSRAPEWDVRSHKPMMCGDEPVPEIERIDE